MSETFTLSFNNKEQLDNFKNSIEGFIQNMQETRNDPILFMISYVSYIIDSANGISDFDNLERIKYNLDLFKKSNMTYYNILFMNNPVVEVDEQNFKLLIKDVGVN